MIPRQAKRHGPLFLITLALAACAAPTAPPPTPTATSAPLTPTAAGVPSPAPSPSATPLACLIQPGTLLQDTLTTTVPPQPFIVYLPPCYEHFVERRYPVLYLLHGQTYSQDQWVRIGAPQTADELIHAGKAPPFIMVFPDDHYWNSPAGSQFGFRLVEGVIPYVDAKYRTRAEKKFRALGGLSRGGGWTAKLGFERPDLFGALGLHSPALFVDYAPYADSIVKNVPEERRPKLWHDIGDADTELGKSLLFEQTLIANDYLHEFHRFAGDHTERYWNAHIKTYLLWYADVWRAAEEQ